MGVLPTPQNINESTCLHLQNSGDRPLPPPSLRLRHYLKPVRKLLHADLSILVTVELFEDVCQLLASQLVTDGAKFFRLYEAASVQVARREQLADSAARHVAASDFVVVLSRCRIHGVAFVSHCTPASLVLFKLRTLMLATG